MTDTGFIVKWICANNGCVVYDHLISNFSATVGNLIEESDLFATVFLNGQKNVIVKAQLRLCRTKNCQGCMNLHLCKFFLLGDCQYSKGRRGCRFDHELNSVHNARVLLKHGLDCLNRNELCILMLHSDNSILPAVCHSYNNGSGPYGRCQDGEYCKRLHICEKYLRGPCQCPRAHDFYEPHPLKTLQERGVPNELLATLRDIYTNTEALRDLAKRSQPRQMSAGATAAAGGGQGTSDRSGSNLPRTSAEKTEICLFFVKGTCKHGGLCRREHSKLPYKWEVKAGPGWVALPDNERIEKEYCDPAKTYSSGIEPVHFDTMTRGYQSVRRLSTVSSVVQPTFILTTTWAWYWEDEYGNWIQYSSTSGSHRASSITNEDLEKKYLEDSTTSVEFTAGSQTYILSFQDMIQTNKQYGTKKVVKRRPVFVSAADAEIIRTSKTVRSTQMNFKILPSHWDKTLIPETGYKRVQLQSSSSEYKEIENLFGDTMQAFRIQQIERIQNKALWEVFQWQRDLMMKNNAGRNVAEKKLFHGTDPKYIDAICLNNFDWRICGTHGTAYGKGSYFAKDANYSHNYTGDSATRCMFVCRILVGEFTVGDPSYVRPPSKDGGDTFFYDSCVNKLHSPSIFVVFEKHQIYPEYLIQYRDVNYSDASFYQPRPTTVNRVRPARPATITRTAASTPPYQPAQVSNPVSLYSYSAPKPPPPPSKQDNSCIIS
ncbi:protein mono-ADP-ribosyltransferase PARP12-like [Brachyhypopomus gauderio]|uniref:protein mono-ADP-ribosyltransferase PARP12-like n=1 Tax=Brachyhypopomus gauderio TaxID=698409 RepID=UPI0040437E77